MYDEFRVFANTSHQLSMASFILPASGMTRKRYPAPQHRIRSSRAVDWRMLEDSPTSGRCHVIVLSAQNCVECAEGTSTAFLQQNFCSCCPAFRASGEIDKRFCGAAGVGFCKKQGLPAASGATIAIVAPVSIRPRGRSGRRSSLCTKLPRSHARTSLVHRCSHRLRPARATRPAIRKSDRPAWRSI